MISKRDRKKKKGWLFSTALSLSIHLFTFLLLYVAFAISAARSLNLNTTLFEYTVDLISNEEPASSKKAPPKEIPLTAPPEALDRIEKKFPNVTRHDANNLLEETQKFSMALKNKWGHFKKMIEVHQESVSEKGQEEILELLGKNFGVHEFTPAEKPCGGEFDWDDFTIHRIEEIAPDGYRILFVDRAGRSETREMFGEEARSIDPLYKAFLVCGNSKMLKPILEYALKTVPSLLKKENP